MVEDEITIFDPTSPDTFNEEQLNFVQILFFRINASSKAKAQNMGKQTIFALKLRPNDTILLDCFNNLAIYENSVQDLQTLLVNYRDDEYIKAVKKIEMDYKNAKQKRADHIERLYKSINRPTQDDYKIYTNNLETLEREFTLKFLADKVDKLREECLKLAWRKNLIKQDNRVEAMW